MQWFNNFILSWESAISAIIANSDLKNISETKKGKNAEKGKHAEVSRFKVNYFRCRLKQDISWQFRRIVSLIWARSRSSEISYKNSFITSYDRAIVYISTVTTPSDIHCDTTVVQKRFNFDGRRVVRYLSRISFALRNTRLCHISSVYLLAIHSRHRQTRAQTACVIPGSAGAAKLRLCIRIARIAIAELPMKMLQQHFRIPV